MEQVFQPEKARDSLVNELRKLAETRGFSKVVVGISGGKDSTVTAAICARALGADHVYGVMMPDGEQKDIADSIRVCEALGIHRRTVNIGKMHAALKEVTDQNTPAAAEGEPGERYQCRPAPEDDYASVYRPGPGRLAGRHRKSQRSHGGILYQRRRHILRFRHARGIDQC